MGDSTSSEICLGKILFFTHTEKAISLESLTTLQFDNLTYALKYTRLTILSNADARNRDSHNLTGDFLVLQGLLITKTSYDTLRSACINLVCHQQPSIFLTFESTKSRVLSSWSLKNENKLYHCNVN